jgi:hypothetical protein
MIHRCETCRFWKQRKNLSYGECRQIEMRDKSDPNGVMMWAEGDACDPVVFTERTFGCVMHPMNKAIA